MTESGNNSIFAELWERRLPQFFATYLGICWGILQFLIFATSRYNLDNSYIDKFLLFATILIPAVLIFIYNHGRPGKDAWKKYEKVLIPLNFVIALVFAGLFAGGNSMNAAPQEIEIVTDEGETVKRLIPSVEQTRTIAIFPFINKNEKEEDQWMKYAISDLMMLDLEQDMRIYGLGPSSFKYEFETNKHKLSDNDIAFSTYHKIAKDDIADYFVTGDFERIGDALNANVKVYSTDNGEIFYESSFEQTDIYSLADQVKKALSDQLFLDNNNELTTADLPAKDLITNNEKALEYQINAINLSREDNNDRKAKKYLHKAINLDNDNPTLLLNLAQAQYRLAELDSARLSIEEALDLAEVLPERQQLQVKGAYYLYSEESDKYLRLLESWRKLYPRDYNPYTTLMNFYTMTQVLKKAKEVGVDALNNGHGKRVLKRLAGICIDRGELEEAEQYIDEYYRTFPDKNRLEDKQLPKIYLKTGDLDKAEKWYNEILLLNPKDHNVHINLADVLSKKGKFDQAEKELASALKDAKVYNDTLSVYVQYMLYATNRADSEMFEKYAQEHFNLISKNTSPIQATFSHAQLSGLYANMGQEQFLYDLGEDVKANTPQIYPLYECILSFIIPMVKEEKEKFIEAYQGQCKTTITTPTPSMDYLAQGIKAKFNEDYPESIRWMETYLDSTETNRDNFESMLAEVYRLDGQVDKAIEYCERSLIVNPTNAFTLIELARSYQAQGKKQKAIEVVKRLRDEIWVKIDENYHEYEDFVALQQSLEL